MAICSCIISQTDLNFKIAIIIGREDDSPEKGMAEGVLGGNTLLGYPSETLLDKVGSLDDIFTAVARAGIAHHDLNQVGLAKVLISPEKLHDRCFTNLVKLVHFS